MLEASLILLTLLLMSAIFHRINEPVIILSLVIGLIFGSDITGLIYFDNTRLAKELANIALMVVLFIGGFGTRKQSFGAVVRPVMFLATLGVVSTALITGLVFHWVAGWSFLQALLLGSIISSTDAAAVFSILKEKPLKRNLRSLIELESVANDPMAVVLTLFVISLLTGSQATINSTVLSFLWKLGGGIGIGILIGNLAVWLFHRIRHVELEFFYVYLLAVILLSYSLAEKCQASGMLSAFFAGFVMGNKPIPFKKGLLTFNNTLSFITNIGLFILLGLLAFPKNFALIWHLGVAVFLIITFVSRPMSVFIFTLGSGLSIKEKLFVTAVGIRGAVPIVLATYPAAMGLDTDHTIFNIVFFTVTLSMLVQGTSIMRLAKLFRLLSATKGKPRKVLDLVTVQDTNYEIIDVYIDEEYYEGSCRISELKLPPGTLITLINRDDKVIAPAGSVEIKPQDTLTILVEKQFIDMIPIEIMRGFIRKNLALKYQE